MADRESILKNEIIKVGKRLYDTGLTVARSGNISVLLDEKTILISATGTYLGELCEGDIVKADLATGKGLEEIKPSSELPLHTLIYKNFPAQVVVHCHPPLINAYFAANASVKALTFETKFYLGDIPVVPQETPTVTDPAPVIAALKSNNLVVLKNHGAVAMGQNFKDSLAIIEALEEAVKTAAVAQLFNKDILNDLEAALKDDLTRQEKAYTIFSREHIQAIVDLVNRDELIAQKGKELDLTVKLAIKLDDTGAAFKFNFEKGKIISLDADADAPYVISAPLQVWEQVFLGKLDSFVAVTQGRMKLVGQLGQLSKWYVPFSRLFSIFKQVRFK